MAYVRLLKGSQMSEPSGGGGTDGGTGMLMGCTFV